MSYSPSPLSTISVDAGGRLRVGQLTTLFDGKTLNNDDPYLWGNVGTGTGSFSATTNIYSMSVTSGQYRIRQSKRRYPYFSGKVSQIEQTFDNFHTQADLVKMVGYYSSSSASNYTADLDGFWLEDNGTTKAIRVYNNGTETESFLMANWNGDPYAQTWFTNNSQNFNVIMWDFLWLGGAVLRLSVKTDRGFVVAHTYHYSGTAEGPMIKSPNQFSRYEIRSSTGTGAFNPICCQVSTEGSIDEGGKNGTTNTGATATSIATTGTTYPLVGIRLASGQFDKSVQVRNFQLLCNTNDYMYAQLILNPTISGAAPTWAAVADTSEVERAVGNTAANIVTAGKVIAQSPITQNSIIPPDILEKDFLSYLGVSPAGTPDELWLCALAGTDTASVRGVLNYKVY